jgi:hypothetical protein
MLNQSDWLRSWVQIPPGPSFPVVQIRYWFEIILGCVFFDSWHNVVILFFKDEKNKEPGLDLKLAEWSITTTREWIDIKHDCSIGYNPDLRILAG